MTSLVAAGLALASLGLSAGASAQDWDRAPRAGAVRDLAPPLPRPDDRRFDDRGFNGPGHDRRLDDRRFDNRRFDDRGRGFDRDRRWGRDDRRGYRGRDRCWIEYRRDGRVTVCR